SAIARARSSAREARALPGSPRDRQLKQFVEFGRVFQIHDALPQFFALLFPDHIAAERSKFHRDFLFSHRIAWIAFRDVDSRRIFFAIVRRDRNATRLKFWK